MQDLPGLSGAFEIEVAGRFGILPNFFRSARATPELLEQLWVFAKAGYLDNPIPSGFKERLFVWLSRFCPMRYCIVRHVGFLLGGAHGRAAGDITAGTHTVDEVIALLRRPSPWHRDMEPVYASLQAAPSEPDVWPAAGSDREDAVFACAAIMFVEPARSEAARHALVRTFGLGDFERLSGCLAFIRTAHYWTMLHPEIETEDDMLALMRVHEELARLLLEDPEANRSEMGERTFAELLQLRDLHEREELKKAKRALEEKDRQKDQFIAVLAHELRNPLAAIRTAAYTLRLLDLPDERAAPIVERVVRQSAAIARMLDDLLDASRTAFGKVSVRLEPFALQSLLTDALEEHGAQARDAGLTLSAEIPEAACFVNSDRMRLRQVLDNLLSNAIKFTPAGGTVSVTVAAGNGSATVAIRDSGIGFDTAFAQRLFEPFVQHEPAREQSSGGLGLGLAIASRLATLLGGSLKAMSPGIGMGAVFTLTMPVVARLNDISIDDSVAKPLIPRIILIVEDNQDLAQGMAELLRLSGASVHIAADGASAIARARETVPDVIVCDLGLPGGMDGYAVARACKADPRLKNVRLVAVSGYGSSGNRAQTLTAGFDAFLVKPLTEDSLRALAQ
ncbi:MAG TPA: hybrid sensor histidine kinase/response regulator [Steroidobacteraceae bacterium]|jgi:signal transduction histidine kinase|nr:hybrid sensor histidine kinase/response regulator [Steroidobacteraceae bacterium]